MPRLVTLGLACFVLCCCGTESAVSGRSPNLVIIYLDDAGYADFGPTGAAHATPHLDRLAEQGVICTSFHVAHPVCSASRAALLTGVYPDRIGVTGALPPRTTIALSPMETTLAELAKTRGYATALFGKWHLGDAPESLPTNHGFDEFAGIPYSNDMWPIRSPDYPPLPFYEGTTVIIPDVQPADQETLTRLLTEYATSFIERQSDVPFLLYVPHPQPHVPLFVSPEFDGASGLGLYADVMMELDWSVGEIIRELEDNGVMNDTWLVVTSDNGPWLSYGNHAGNAGPFREGKHTVFEGGTRVPCVMHLPGESSPGRVLTQPLMNIDILPTFAALIGAPLPELSIDGSNVWSILSGEEAAPSKAYFFWYEQALQAVSRGRWKLHFPHRYSTVVEPGSDGVAGQLENAELPLSLFDLVADPGERENLVLEQPEIVEQLTSLANAHIEELQAHRREPGPL